LYLGLFDTNFDYFLTNSADSSNLVGYFSGFKGKLTDFNVDCNGLDDGYNDVCMFLLKWLIDWCCSTFFSDFHSLMASYFPCFHLWSSKQVLPQFRVFWQEKLIKTMFFFFFFPPSYNYYYQNWLILNIIFGLIRFAF